MANILDKIIQHKIREVEQAKASVSIRDLEQAPLFARQTISLRQALSQPASTGIIAEFKRRSPSKGLFQENADPSAITKAYTAGGAAALSVLTDSQFFGGSADDLMQARVNPIPILRKDFIIDRYQLMEAKAMGADVILLIAACLEPGQVRSLAAFASGIGLEVLLEIHEEEELGHICEEIDLVGVNNRDLKTFTVDLDRSVLLSEKIGAGKLKIAESGISNTGDIHFLRQHGFQGFLIGEAFMKEADPAFAFANFVNQLKRGTA
ncbi:MAG: indole-3-glycerol phosphate synthase TrpC [Williamsia sp.]|nr:indole-3-glycerol phosphate synthase TrpC [Williamsia sp.]